MGLEIGGNYYRSRRDYAKQNDPNQFLKDVDDKILKYRKSQNTNYVVHNVLGYGVIGLGVLSTVMAAITGLDKIWPAVVGGVVTEIGAAVKFGKFSNWTQWRYFANKLQKERDAYVGGHDAYKGLPKEEKDDLFFKRAWAIMEEAEPKKGEPEELEQEA